ncbi:DtxR family iron (metal) dependent repressor [Hydrogenispora ethanolica]|uniref:DtxR family iron (Metal) dependent repressor n=1 Tax=Hydrogenispora ethanolica TaxID=1082276 RepID=A0A4R1RA06_HYDET|nr:metal-dependent transcriptional regulator [Hydrogenispora ethanolica]TCL62420.1 DtxR family iron (metal) dependent repressor [Hydrogenispora ethanolica]
MDRASISPALEDYLKVILELQEAEEAIRVTDLAQKLGVAKSSVNQAVARLVELALLTHERYGPLELTGRGLAKAREIRERHDSLRQFFSDVLEVEPRIAERDACSIEHYISPATMEKLVDYLNGLAKSDES